MNFQSTKKKHRRRGLRQVFLMKQTKIQTSDLVELFANRYVNHFMERTTPVDLTHQLAVSYYKTIATINESHKIFLVQHQSSKRIFVKKILDVYNIDVYRTLYQHPILGTPRIIDYCENDNQLILIEEYISGTPLSDKIVNRDITDEDIRNYTLDLCDTLEKLHALNPPVIHRDIKPSNIIITNYQRAVLLDFNAAKHFSLGEVEDTILLGTKGYAAPEQYGFGSSSPQTDIYSLGIVIKEMIAACHSSANELKHLELVADKCTQLSPKERYSSIEEMKEALSASDNRSKNVHIPVTNSIRRFLPPGYRTRAPWKMFVSTIVYFFIIWLCMSLEIKNVTGPALWIERIVILIAMLSIIFGCFNYLNIQKLMPLCQHKNRFVRYLGIFILDFALVFSLLLMLFILETLVFQVV